MKVTVTTNSLHPAFRESSKKINWDDSSDRKWLMNHLHWAMHNSREVLICAPQGIDCEPESN